MKMVVVQEGRSSDQPRELQKVGGRLEVKVTTQGKVPPGTANRSEQGCMEARPAGEVGDSKVLGAF